MNVKITVETQSQMKRLVDQLQSGSGQAKGSEWRRTEWRLSIAIPGAVGADGAQTEPLYVTTRDISVGGTGFLSFHPLKLNLKVVVLLDTELGEIEIPATVVHCTGSVGAYKIGVRFDLRAP